MDNAGYEAFDELIKTLYPLLNNFAKLEQLLQMKAELQEVSLDEYIQLVKKCVGDCNSNSEVQQNKIQVIHVPSDYGKKAYLISYYIRKYIPP